MSSAEPDIALPTSDELYAAASAVLDEARAKGLTVGTAESCTGGLVAANLTEVPGSSDVVRGGVVSYAIAVKHAVLGVSSEILDDPALGAVSAECAQQMAQGARRVLGADVAVSITGIAGPGGEEPGKPVGTVWFGLDAPHGGKAVCHCFSGNRSEVRTKATLVATKLLLDGIRYR